MDNCLYNLYNIAVYWLLNEVEAATTIKKRAHAALETKVVAKPKKKDM
jgi:hypothetical protein